MNEIFSSHQTISLFFLLTFVEIQTFYLHANRGDIYSKNYPNNLRTNIEYTWIIDMNQSNTIEFEFHDIHMDFETDYLHIQTDHTIYSITTQESLRFQSVNRTIITLRTKHSQSDDKYRGIYLSYQTQNENRNLIVEKMAPCGRISTSTNGTIEYSSSIYLSFDCYFFLEIDDGQNLFIQIEYLNWDSRENFLEIGLFHEINQNRLFHISGIRQYHSYTNFH